MLGIKYDMFSHTSDHFDRLIELCEKMIQLGKAYVDDTDPELMKKEREERKNSKNRDNSKFHNLLTSCLLFLLTNVWFMGKHFFKLSEHFILGFFKCFFCRNCFLVNQLKAYL